MGLYNILNICILQMSLIYHFFFYFVVHMIYGPLDPVNPYPEFIQLYQ